MNEQKLLSVVIPVYNVEKYLKEALDSVVNQTYKNLQIILVDDGSTDSSGEICDLYAKQDNRITVIHQENAGAGAAKNAGLELVKGEYFSIIDSDDYIELNMYEKMLGYMESYRSDVVQCLFRNVFVNHKVDCNYLIKSKDVRKVKRNKFLKEYLYDWKYAIFANKVFKTSLLKDIRFPVGRKIDDEFFTYKLICNSKAIVNTKEVFYNYRMRKSSVMNNNSDERLIMDRVDCFIERYEYIKKYAAKLGEEYYIDLSDKILYYSKELTANKLLLQLAEKYPIKYNLTQKLSVYYRRSFTTNDELKTEENDVFYE
ncbi:MAG: glycosyltransferase family 2 protein [Ruminococcus sp.]|nr:glycosyltransferase family 2 protein [Ruminococcus sp.]